MKYIFSDFKDCFEENKKSGLLEFWKPKYTNVDTAGVVSLLLREGVNR